VSAETKSDHEQGSASEGEDRKNNGGRDIYDDGSCDDPRSGGANGGHGNSSRGGRCWAGRKVVRLPSTSDAGRCKLPKPAAESLDQLDLCSDKKNPVVRSSNYRRNPLRFR